MPWVARSSPFANRERSQSHVGRCIKIRDAASGGFGAATLDIEDERRKLELVASTALDVWGYDIGHRPTRKLKEDALTSENVLHRP